jgi:hypothetical protein
MKRKLALIFTDIFLIVLSYLGTFVLNYQLHPVGVGTKKFEVSKVNSCRSRLPDGQG